MLEDADKGDILIFFTTENGVYDKTVLKLLGRYNGARSRIWPVAMDAAPECRRPPEPVSDRQSFDVLCWKENRNPLKIDNTGTAQNKMLPDSV